ncbi:hypothetical protein [Roseixanthobacter pseudopolyaromaticivorans]|uniref:hypothetical protein n=1 Tax=Xanthobacteraceae TaxID=335928 RepID=UPI003726B083
MDIKEFTKLIESTVAAAGGADTLAACMTKPAGTLVAQYGPLTDKIMKDKAVAKALELYDEHMVRVPNQQFANALAELALVVNGLPAQATTGATTAMGALVYQTQRFDANLSAVLAGVKPPPAGMMGVLLAVMDTSITAGLAFVPVAGPFLVPLSQGLGSAIGFGINAGIQRAADDPALLFNTGNAQQKADQKTAISGSSDVNSAQNRSDAAGNAGKAISSGVSNAFGAFDKESTIGQLAAQKGIASLVATGIGMLVKRNEESVLKNPDSTSGRAFTNVMMGQVQSQNQSVAVEINSLNKINLKLPDVLRPTADRTKFYLDEKKSLGDFRTKTQEMFIAFYKLISQVISAGLRESFKSSTDKIDRPLTNEQKIALLILGYFYAKRWDKGAQIATRTTDLQRLGIEKSDIETSIQRNTGDLGNAQGIDRGPIEDRISQLNLDLRTKEGQIASIQQEMAQLMSKKNTLTAVHTFWQQAGNQDDALMATSFATYQKASTALSKKNFLGAAFTTSDISIDKLDQVKAASKEYFSALKDALVSDISTAMNKGNEGIMNDKDMVEMWKVYIGANLIINQTLRDAKLKETSKLTRFSRAITPTTDATSIDSRYIQMLEDAGFIERYVGTFGVVTKAKKATLAATGRLRWSVSPSNTERAMVIAFCTVVAFSLDVGKISLGFCSWKETKLALNEVCKTISNTAVK